MLWNQLLIKICNAVHVFNATKQLALQQVILGFVDCASLFLLFGFFDHTQGAPGSVLREHSWLGWGQKWDHSQSKANTFPAVLLLSSQHFNF